MAASVFGGVMQLPIDWYVPCCIRSAEPTRATAVTEPPIGIVVEGLALCTHRGRGAQQAMNPHVVPPMGNLKRLFLVGFT